MLQLGSRSCHCTRPTHDTRLVAVTGGPGGGKTAILQLARRSFCQHVAVLPEAASLVFGGGFPRHATLEGRKAAQRAIFYVQREAERLVVGEHEVALGLCDRGTVDGAAYWPGDPDELWSDVHTALDREVARYDVVIHLETPSIDHGYNYENPLRIESAAEACRIDRQIAEVWRSHPNRHVIPSSAEFIEKAQTALKILASLVPECCENGWEGV